MVVISFCLFLVQREIARTREPILALREPIAMKDRIFITLIYCCIALMAIVSSSSATVSDFDGDGKTDLTIIKIQNGGQKAWHTLRSSDSSYGYAEWGRNFGVGGSSFDTEIIGDFDGDGKTDHTRYGDAGQPLRAISTSLKALPPHSISYPGASIRIFASFRTTMAMVRMIWR